MDGLRRGLAYAATLLLYGARVAVPAVAQEAEKGFDFSKVAGGLNSVMATFMNMLLVVGMVMLGIGILFKFLPTGSHRTKDAGGSLLDNAFLLTGFGVVGVYALYWAAVLVASAAGVGTEGISKPSSPWQWG